MQATTADRPLTPIYCPRCRQRLFEAHLAVGSEVRYRCHQTIKLDGKRQTCGYVVRVMPSRPECGTIAASE